MRRREPPQPALTRFVNWLGDCCGMSYVVCYGIFSLWGFIMLLVLGGLLAVDYEPVHLNELNMTQSQAAASGAYGAAGLYGLLVVLCGIRFAVLKFRQRNQVLRI